MMDDNILRRFCIPPNLVTFLSRIGSLHHPHTAIDPCCEDVSVIEACSYVPERYALFRNPNAMKEAARLAPSVGMELKDITRVAQEREYDLVATVVPFGATERVAGSLLRLDESVAERCLDLIAPHGVCLLVVPPNFLTAPLFSAFRNRVLDNKALDAVIELPARSLWENSAVGGALLVIRNGPVRETGTYLSVYERDRTDTLLTGIRDGTGHFFVNADDLRERWDRHFHDPSHRVIANRLDQFETKRLDELGEIRRGHPRIAQRASESGQYLILSLRHLRGDAVTHSDRDRFVNDDHSEDFSRSVVLPGDVVVSLMRPHAYVFQKSDPPAVAGLNIAIIRARDNEYISTYLNTDEGRQLFQAQAERYAATMGGMSHLSMSALREIRIPILPVDDLNSVSDKSISQATTDELELLRDEMLRLKKKLEVTEAKLEQERLRDGSAHRTLVERQLARILEQQQATNAKLDQIVRVLAAMRDDVGAIKLSSRDDEEKLARIYSKLDSWMETTTDQERTMDEYIRVVQTWLDAWDKLESLTRTLLPSAEHLYDELEKIQATDFSPFVVQYCRSLENEILSKLFGAYHDDVRSRIIDIPSFVATDLQEEKPGKKKNTARFAGSVKKDDRRYTLGDMNFIMQLTKVDGSTLAGSPLLQDFRAFVLRYFDARIAEKAFLDRVREINDDLRNKAAHPSLMPKELADKCIALVRVSLSELLDAYHVNRPPISPGPSS